MSDDRFPIRMYTGLPSERAERLVLTWEEEEEPPRAIGRGRGRGRGLPINEPTPPPTPPPIPPVEENPQSSPTQSHVGSGPTQSVPPKKGTKGGSKFVMFLQYMKKVNGVDGYKSVNDLIKLFDKDWKELPEEEKAAWKAKAKSVVVSTPSQPAKTVSTPRVAAQYRSLYRNVEKEDDE